MCGRLGVGTAAAGVFQVVIGALANEHEVGKAEIEGEGDSRRG